MGWKIEDSPTFRLFSVPTFLDGMGSVVSLDGTCHSFNMSRSPDEADRLALYADLLAVGDDFRVAIGRAKEEAEEASSLHSA
jgi:hypothetical protein